MLKIVKLGSKVTDTATGLDGTVTHVYIDVDHRQRYAFQPFGLNPKTLQPLAPIWLASDRFKQKDLKCESVEMPLETLGTTATDMASGFTGTVVNITMHISGCVHLTIQPAGRLPETGNIVDSAEFDIRRLTGPAIPKMNEAERKADQAARPSPSFIKRSLR